MRLFQARSRISRHALPWVVACALSFASSLPASPLLDSDRPEYPPDTTELDSQARDCLRCHAMETLAYRDPETGEILDLAVDPRLLSHSVHGEMACTECHRRSYRRYPHPEQAGRETFSCVGCHEDDPEDATYQFLSIEEEYARSVHVAPGASEAEDFSCHSCHDPHVFRVSRVGKEIGQVVRDDNRVCMSCHRELTDPLDTTHAWLPKRDAHWASVRCLECHTPPSDRAERVSHQILPAEDSARDCVGCHSSDARLLNRLYHYRSQEDLARKGLIAKALFNEAYVVGMSRNPTLDALSLLVIGLTLLGLTAHGVGRYLTYRRRTNRQ